MALRQWRRRGGGDDGEPDHSAVASPVSRSRSRHAGELRHWFAGTSLNYMLNYFFTRTIFTWLDFKITMFIPMAIGCCVPVGRGWRCKPFLLYKSIKIIMFVIRSTIVQIQDLWNPMRNGSAPHHTSELTLSFSSPSPSSISGYTSCYNNNNMMSSKPWQLEARQPWPIHGHEGQRMAMASYHDHHPLDTNPSPESNSVSNSSDGGETRRPKFIELNAENLKILCNALESHVPQHSNIVPDIASTVLQCRSGMKKMKLRHKEIIKASSTTWLLFQGRDVDGKKAMAQELAKLVFGSSTEFSSISFDELTSPYSDSSSGELTLKRQRSADSNEHSFAQRLCEIVSKNPHQVIVINDIEQLDQDSEISIKKAIANGRMRGCTGEEVDFEDAIIVLSYEEEFDSRSRASSSPRVKQRLMNNNDDEESSSTEKGDNSPQRFSLDLNACLEDEEEDEGFLLIDNGVGMHDIVDGVFFFGLMADF